MNLKKKVLILTCLLAGTMITACQGNAGSQEGAAVQDSNQSENTVLNIAYQYGTAYVPLIVAKEQKLIEAAYNKETGKPLTINWQQMPKGADINTGIASGDIQAGFMGAAPAITGCLKGVGYKVFTNLSGQEHAMYTNDTEIVTLGDLIGSDKQIALVNNGSIQHIILAMALVDNGYDAHALDANIVAMSHPDGMVALQSGSVPCQLTSSPYIYMEEKDDNLSKIQEISDSWSVENSFIVGVAAESLYNDNQMLYNALCTGISDAIDYVNTNPEDAAAISCTYNGNSVEDELLYIQKGIFSKETKELLKTATFMIDNGFAEADSVTEQQLMFDNVQGN